MLYIQRTKEVKSLDNILNKMEGNFLSRYNNKLVEWNNLILKDPKNKKKYESEMSEYMLECMPYVNMYIENVNVEDDLDNVFNCKVEQGLQKRDIFDAYLAKVEKCNNVSLPTKKKLKKCKVCDDPWSLYTNTSEGIIVCTTCGLVVEDGMVSEELSYREEQESSEKIINYSYKRENHFNEWLSQFQAKEKTTIPPEVMEQLRTELKKQKIKKVDEITHTKVRTILKKLKYNKFYEHIPFISNMLNGIEPPNMSQELEDKLRKMFKDIQKPFDDSCPKERKNFLSYSYVLYKFCELLGEDDYLVCFPLLKSKEKLYQQDQIWKKICAILLWEFIPTV